MAPPHRITFDRKRRALRAECKYGENDWRHVRWFADVHECRKWVHQMRQLGHTIDDLCLGRMIA